ncbi:MAG: nicotinate-nucleotide diphosphorylase (carboxylating) [Micrococcales bacterium]|nr:nicotinate-nucleotide diphosphorylase (carboxylating) [Micrococcales bacterium]
MPYSTHGLSAETVALLTDAGLRPLDVESLAVRALEEDVDGGVDVTTVATVPMEQRGRLALVARGGGVVAGLVVARAIFEVVCGDDMTCDVSVEEGSLVELDTELMAVTSFTHNLLRAERPALNAVSHLSGIATATRAWVAAIADTDASVRDTRKTTPGLRGVEKYAVRAGGGVNHRMNLADAALVKDNHVEASGGVDEAFRAVRRAFPEIPIEVEVDTLEQLDVAIDAGADLILLDNFSVQEMAEAVRRTSGRALLEASGGLTLDQAAAVAATGVDYLAVGTLTHSSPVLDIGADLIVVSEES